MRNTEKKKGAASGGQHPKEITLKVGDEAPQPHPGEKNLHLVNAFVRLGKRGKWQQVELLFYGNPLRTPLMIRRPARDSFRELTPINFSARADS